MLRSVGQSHTPVHRHPNGNKDDPGHLHGLRHFPVQLCADAAWLNAIGDLTAQVRYDRVMRNAPAPPARLGADAIMQEFRVPSTLYTGLDPGEVRRDDNISLTVEAPDKFMQAFEQTGRAVAMRGTGSLADEVSLALLLTAKRCQKEDPSGVMDLVLVAARNPTEELARAPRVQMPSQAPKRTSASNLQQRRICEVRTALVNHIFNGPAQVAATTSAVQTRGESGGDDIIINNDDDVEQEAGPQDETGNDDASDDANNEGTALSNDNDDDDDEVAVGDKRGRGSDVEQRAAKRHAGALQEDNDARSVDPMSDTGDSLRDEDDLYGCLWEPHMAAALATP